MDTLVDPLMQSKPTEYGSGFIVKDLPDKKLICVDIKTRIKQGNFNLEGEHIVVECGHGIKISSKHPNTLVISADLTKLEEKIFDLEKAVDKRLETIEKIFTKIIKDTKK